MSNQDEYVIKSIQAKFSKKQIDDKLKDYVLVKPNKIADLKEGTMIRYISNGQFRSGGALKRNNFPKYLVLMNINNKMSWCVQLAVPDLKIYAKNTKKESSTKSEKEKIYEMYKKGQLVQPSKSKH